MVLSLWATSTLEEVAQSSPTGLKWFHVYLIRNEKYTISHIRRAERAGYKALVLTIDSPYRAFTRTENFEFPRHLPWPAARMLNLENSTPEVPVWVNPATTWDVVQWLRYYFRF